MHTSMAVAQDWKVTWEVVHVKHAVAETGSIGIAKMQQWFGRRYLSIRCKSGRGYDVLACLLEGVRKSGADMRKDSLNQHTACSFRLYILPTITSLHSLPIDQQAVPTAQAVSTYTQLGTSAPTASTTAPA